MADLSIPAKPAATIAFAEPVSYANSFPVVSAKAIVVQQKVNILINESEISISICPCEFPILSFEILEIPILSFVSYAIPEINFTTHVSRLDCEDC